LGNKENSKLNRCVIPVIPIISKLICFFLPPLVLLHPATALPEFVVGDQKSLQNKLKIVSLLSANFFGTSP